MIVPNTFSHGEKSPSRAFENGDVLEPDISLGVIAASVQGFSVAVQQCDVVAAASPLFF